MFFSIIIPVYKVENYLVECLESVRKQTFKDFEAILIDDGSPDNCPHICDSYITKDKRFRVIHQENHGLSHARNQGIKIAKGDFIVFLDSDDLLLSTALENIKNVIEKETDVVVTEILNVLNIKDSYQQKELFTPPVSKDKDEAFKFIFSKKRNIFASVQYIVKRTLLIEKQICFEEGYFHEDNAYTPLMLSYAKFFAFYSGIWYIRRYHRPESITNTKNVKRILDIIELTWKYETDNMFAELNLKQRRLIYYQMISALWWHLSFYNSYEQNEKKQIIQALKKHKSIIQYSCGVNQCILNHLCSIMGFSVTITMFSHLKRIVNRFRVHTIDEDVN